MRVTPGFCLRCASVLTTVEGCPNHSTQMNTGRHPSQRGRFEFNPAHNLKWRVCLACSKPQIFSARCTLEMLRLRAVPVGSKEYSTASDGEWRFHQIQRFERWRARSSCLAPCDGHARKSGLVIRMVELNEKQGIPVLVKSIRNMDTMIPLRDNRLAGTISPVSRLWLNMSRHLG